MAEETGLSISDPLQDAEVVANHIREGRFQRSLALLTAATSVVSGLEVAYEHYRGSYSRRVMYTPVILSGLLAVAGVAGLFSRRAARTVLRLVSFVTLADAMVGFYFHVRGIHRKPGGWRLPMTNMIMGPPIFAPLLFGTSAYLGLIASYLQREEGTAPASQSGKDAFLARLLPSRSGRALMSAEQDMREGKFQRQVAIVTGISALLSGFEAYYSHYKNNFRYWVQWTPIAIAPVLAGVAFGSVKSRRLAKTALPAVSVVAGLDAAVGFYYHGRGVLRRPGGSKRLLYNIMYGPPIFAPLLFGAAGMLGVLASLLRRRQR
jgi:cytochrome bd-type quinol oxidase subunit 2